MTRPLTLALLAGLLGCQSAPVSAPSVAVPCPPARGLSLMDMDGGTHDVDSALQDGRLVTLVFWQTWCGACLAEAPELAQAAREHAGAIDYIGVVTGPDEIVDDAQVRRVAAERGMPYAQVRDRDIALAQAFDVTGTPTIVVLGPGPAVLYRGHRSPDWSALLR